MIGVGRNGHYVDFSGIAGVASCCQGFETGLGGDYHTQLFLESALSPTWSLRPTLSIQNLGGAFRREENILLAGRTPGIFEHRIDATIQAIGIQGLVGYRPSPRTLLALGPQLLFIAKNDFAQAETILSPSGGAFLFADGSLSRVRNASSGSVSNANRLIAGIAGLASIEFPMTKNKKWMLAPSAFFSLPIGSLTRDSSWQVWQLGIGVAVSYLLDDGLPPPNDRIRKNKDGENVNSKLVAAPEVTAQIRAVGRGENGRESASVVFRVEEFLSTQVQPILPYVFFATGSSILPERYTTGVTRANVSGVDTRLAGLDPLQAYQQILDIIGSRMIATPNARINLLGTSDGQEQGSRTIGMERAKAIEDYLVTTWKIGRDRISVSSLVLPSKPSGSNNEDGRHENRRVEISATDPSVLAPIMIVDTLRFTNPPTVRFYPTASPEDGISTWKVSAGSKRSPFKLFEGRGMPPDYIDWPVDVELRHKDIEPGPLEYSLSVADTGSTMAESGPKFIPVDYIALRDKRSSGLVDKEIDQFSLILFDYNSSALKGANASIVNSIRAKVRTNSNLSISGYTDRSGEAVANRQLALERAKAVYDALALGKGAVEGIGEDVLLYDNDLPEGRFYSRTVTVRIETPVQ